MKKRILSFLTSAALTAGMTALPVAAETTQPSGAAALLKQVQYGSYEQYTPIPAGSGIMTPDGMPAVTSVKCWEYAGIAFTCTDADALAAAAPAAHPVLKSEGQYLNIYLPFCDEKSGAESEQFLLQPLTGYAEAFAGRWGDEPGMNTGTDGDILADFSGADGTVWLIASHPDNAEALVTWLCQQDVQILGVGYGTWEDTGWYDNFPPSVYAAPETGYTLSAEDFGEYAAAAVPVENSPFGYWRIDLPMELSYEEAQAICNTLEQNPKISYVAHQPNAFMSEPNPDHLRVELVAPADADGGGNADSFAFTDPTEQAFCERVAGWENVTLQDCFLLRTPSGDLQVLTPEHPYTIQHYRLSPYRIMISGDSVPEEEAVLKKWAELLRDAGYRNQELHCEFKPAEYGYDVLTNTDLLLEECLKSFPQTESIDAQYAYRTDDRINHSNGYVYMYSYCFQCDRTPVPEDFPSLNVASIRCDELTGDWNLCLNNDQYSDYFAGFRTMLDSEIVQNLSFDYIITELWDDSDDVQINLPERTVIWERGAAAETTQPVGKVSLTAQSDENGTCRFADLSGWLDVTDPENPGDAANLFFAYHDGLAQSDGAQNCGVVTLASTVSLYFRSGNLPVVRGYAQNVANAFGCAKLGKTNEQLYQVTLSETAQDSSGNPCYLIQVYDYLLRDNLPELTEAMMTAQTAAHIQPYSVLYTPVVMSGKETERGAAVTGNWRSVVNPGVPIETAYSETAAYVQETGKAWTVTDENGLTVLPDEMTDDNLAEIITYMYRNYQMIPKPTSLDESSMEASFGTVVLRSEHYDISDYAEKNLRRADGAAVHFLDPTGWYGSEITKAPDFSAHEGLAYVCTDDLGEKYLTGDWSGSLMNVTAYSFFTFDLDGAAEADIAAFDAVLTEFAASRDTLVYSAGPAPQLIDYALHTDTRALLIDTLNAHPEVQALLSQIVYTPVFLDAANIVTTDGLKFMKPDGAVTAEQLRSLAAEKGLSWTVSDEGEVSPETVTTESLTELLTAVSGAYPVLLMPSPLDNSAGAIALQDDGSVVLGLKGDVDYDGKVTGYDASLALLGFIERSNDFAESERTLTPAQEKIADVDGDGELTAFDSSMILTYFTMTAAQYQNLTWADVLPKT